MIQPERISWYEDRRPVPGSSGEYVLYWMQAAVRAEYNHALEYAIELANEQRKPLVLLFVLTNSYPEGNLRHLIFLCEGLIETGKMLSGRGIRLVIRNGDPVFIVSRLASEATSLVMDRGYLHVQREWRERIVSSVSCPVAEIETEVVVPVGTASSKREWAARTFRPRISSRLSRFLVPLKSRKLLYPSLDLSISSLSADKPQDFLSGMDIDRSVPPSPLFTGGLSEAKRRLSFFLGSRLERYNEGSADPNARMVSDMSPYLHFGQISPLYVALEVVKMRTPGDAAYLEQLLVRRELSINYAWYNPGYDRFGSLPDWCLRTLGIHARDERPALYSRDEFEHGETHDVYWNAMQLEMNFTGKLHGYLRMYWGKKILEWTESPETAWEIMLALNNRYELDGRDPNGYCGVAWCFGNHDRPWSERPVFGTVRYMNEAGLKRKFRMDAYRERVERMISGW